MWRPVRLTLILLWFMMAQRMPGGGRGWQVVVQLSLVSPNLNNIMKITRWRLERF